MAGLGEGTEGGPLGGVRRSICDFGSLLPQFPLSGTAACLSRK